ncbi:hypothetical protein RO3G_15484 [Rhizopus delemar RA 99-880]|uniref:Peptidase M13 C-terminal domain-containing protein n=1 Tax=Rhizopus delemar (strain RA 99-880 / ATCC MYA-4621 / FGSC 9543 / NRRL 43880) TaxID=246409 RepID=I1CQP3_RHIO9|nr:hypothetical protein RO3G_15484 [Rhizopus delemar RA 99-880]|eukprot:EIE90773.1 hypothetical protein RO3G_15484 [Rhizopus delemar RA 99-880]
MPGGVLEFLAAYPTQIASSTANVCNSQVCQTTATSILNSLNLNVDPCDDFYQYTYIGTFSDLRIKNDTGLLNSTQIDQDRANFNKMKAYYDSCTNETAIDALGPTPIYSHLSKVLNLFDYSSKANQSLFRLEDANTLADGMTELMIQGSDNLVLMEVSLNRNRSNQYTIFFGQPALTLSDKEDYTKPDVIDQYRNGLISLLTYVLGQPNGTDTNMRLQKMNESNLSPLGPEAVESMVDRFVNFESHLANMTTYDDDYEEAAEITLTELNQNYPFANWTRIFNQFVPSHVALPDHVILSSPKYMTRLNDWLLSNPADGVSIQAIHEYFIIQFIMTNVEYLDKTTKDIYSKTIDKLTGGSIIFASRKQACVEDISINFTQLLGRYFAMTSSGGEPQRQRVSKFVENMLSVWAGRLERNTWLDDETRTRAMEKLKMITHEEVYGIIDPDTRSPSSLEVYYADIQVDSKDFFSNTLSAYESTLKKEWVNLGKHATEERIKLKPYEVNAYYSPAFNEVAILASILREPFYHIELPDYLNYGALGSIIGHEITHAFDDTGRLYDGHGLYQSWWTNASSNEFEDRAQCFVNQYGNFSIEGPNRTQHFVDGQLTLGENLADNGGIAAAYEALFSKNTDKHMLLPGLETFSPQQLFFINFASG